MLLCCQKHNSVSNQAVNAVFLVCSFEANYFVLSDVACSAQHAFLMSVLFLCPRPFTSRALRCLTAKMAANTSSSGGRLRPAPPGSPKVKACDGAPKMSFKVKHSSRKRAAREMYNKVSNLWVPGDNCRVRDPKTGYEFDLSSLKGKDYSINTTQYSYQLSICGALQKDVCAHKDAGKSVSSCQVGRNNQKIAGMETQNFLQNVT